jgi:hypothetical protein
LTSDRPQFLKTKTATTPNSSQDAIADCLVPTRLLGEDNLESFALQNLEQCYGEDEPEYSLNLIKEHNSNYARK